MFRITDRVLTSSILIFVFVCVFAWFFMENKKLWKIGGVAPFKTIASHLRGLQPLQPTNFLDYYDRFVWLDAFFFFLFTAPLMFFLKLGNFDRMKFTLL
jgi:hypothetical protein